MSADPRQPRRTGYCVAVGATAGAVAVRLIFDPWFADAAPLLPFLAAAIISAWAGGLWPGLLATALGGLVGAVLFLTPDRAVPLAAPSVGVRLAVYTLVAALVSSFFEALHRSRRLLTSTLESIADAFARLDRNWRYRYVNAEQERMVGRSRGELVGRPVWEVWPELLGTTVETEFRRAMADRVPGEFEYYHAPRDRWFSVKVYPTADGGLTVCAREVTDHRRTQLEIERLNVALADRVRELQAVLDAAPVGINVATDPQCREIRGNRALAAMLGMAEGDNVSKSRPDADRLPYRVLRDGREVPADDLPMQRAARLGVRVDAEMFDFERADGLTVTCMVTAVPVRGQGGAVTGAVGVCADVTALRRAEQALRDADRRKDEFLATLAHELRNPLAPVRSGLEVLRAGEVDAATAERTLAMMDRQVSHLVVLIDDLLDVSRITRGKLTLRREPVQLSAVIEHAREAVAPFVEQHQHRLTIETPADPITLCGDLTRLAQVVGNLLTNSAKYTPPGGDIRLTASRDGAAAVIRVTDTGIGIPPAAIGRVFDLFSQVDRTLEKSTGGLGIGLALVKGLVEMHGGTVVAHSGGAGTGSTFTVRLPLAAESQLARADAAPATPRPTPRPVSKRRVLVVDDNRDAADSLAVLLNLTGHEARSAYDGLHAVAAASDFQPHVILMDVGMPKLNGLDATRRIREQSWSRSVHIVALTGWGQDADRERTAEAGCDGHLVKPVSPAVVVQLLADLPACD